MKLFKLGDRVICTRMENPPPGIELKKTYKVVAIQGDEERTVALQLDNGHVYYCPQDFRTTHEAAPKDADYSEDIISVSVEPEKNHSVGGAAFTTTLPDKVWGEGGGGGAEPLHHSKLEVKLIDYTGAASTDPARYALALLLFVKDTRLEMTPHGFQAKLDLPYQENLEALKYVVNTIPSSWEFIDYTFMIRNVTRAFTHQLVRTRTASYAQQTMRTLDVTGWDYATGPTIEEDAPRRARYHKVMGEIAAGYEELIAMGAKPEDARGILPTNILTNICMKMNLRTFVDLCRKRGSARTQDEYRHVVEQMKAEALRVHPWLELFLARTVDKAINDLEQMLVHHLEEPQRAMALKLLLQVRGY